MANKKEKTIVSQFTEIEKILRENGHTDLADFMVDRIAKQTAKNSAKGGESSTAKLNKALADVLYESMSPEMVYTATIVGRMGVEGISSTSKATAILKILVEDGKVINIKEKGTSTYKVV